MRYLMLYNDWAKQPLSKQQIINRIVNAAQDDDYGIFLKGAMEKGWEIAKTDIVSNSTCVSHPLITDWELDQKCFCFSRQEKRTTEATTHLNDR